MTLIEGLLISWEITQNLEVGKRSFWVSYQGSTRHYLIAYPTRGLSDLVEIGTLDSLFTIY